jgi:flagellar hook-basal body complex protein FliE
LNITSVASGEKLIANSPKSVSAVDLTREFGQALNEAIERLNAQEAEVEQLREQFMTGRMTDPHNLMIAAEKVSLGLELTVQVRNKAIEAYQEIMRMQI